MKTVTCNARHRKRLILIILFLAFSVWFFNPGVHLLGHNVPSESLTFAKRQFYLNGKPFRILSGAVHYFRVPEEYWEDRMLKMKACGLNTLETYVAWNLHEPTPGNFDYCGRLNLRKYLQLAHKLGLYVILRPGPYICSEWDFGGMPSWLLADPEMVVRSNYKGYQDAVARFFGDLLHQVADLQFTQGGPIIAVQVESELGSYSNETDHLRFLKGLLRKHGITELLVTSDGTQGIVHASFFNDALPTANFKHFHNGQAIFEMIHQANPEFPLMVMEFGTGWFDHWGEPHNVNALQDYARNLDRVLRTGASINLYMFHGGTNFGFMAGANDLALYKPDVTSYDYDAPLSEAGDITEKYLKTRELLLNLVYKPQGIEDLPEIPANSSKTAYVKLRMEEIMTWTELLLHVTKWQHSKGLQPMEMYKFDNKVGQSYGYIVYQKLIHSATGKELRLNCKMHDRAQVLLNGQSVALLEQRIEDNSIYFTVQPEKNTLDIVVENLGRVNFATMASDRKLLNEQHKGLFGYVQIDDKHVTDWIAMALDFDHEFIYKVSHARDWKPYFPQENMPALLRAYLDIDDTPADTFINMKEFVKGIVIVNGINLGRYWDVGPQKTLYLPAPFLRKGGNEILVFEEHSAGEYMHFQEVPNLG